MPQIDPLILILAMLPALVLSVFIHEVGHAVLGYAAGYIITSFGVGMARPLFVVPFRGVRIFFCLSKPFNGITFAFHPDLLPSKHRLVAYLAGGVLFNAALALFCFVLLQWTPRGGSVWLSLLIFNTVLAVSSLIPFQVKVGKAVLRSDGALILQAIRCGMYSQPAPITVLGLEFLQTLSLSVGDATLSQIGLLGGAEAWAALEDSERADALMVQASNQPDSKIPALQAFREYVRAEVALSAGRTDEATTAIDRAESIFRSEHHDVGLMLVSLLRVAVRIHRQEWNTAASTLDHLRFNPSLQSRPNIGLARTVLRLSTAFAEADPPAIERLCQEYTSLQGKVDSPTIDLAIRRSLARFHAERGDMAAAAPAFRRAVSRVEELADYWTDPDERMRFLSRHKSLADEARQCLISLGQTDEADRLLAPILTPADRAKQVGEIALIRNRRLRKAGLRVMLANILILAFAFAINLGLELEPVTGGKLLFLAMFLSLFTIVGALHLAFDLAVGRRLTGLRTSGGAVTLLLACFPWLVLAMMIVIILSTSH